MSRVLPPNIQWQQTRPPGIIPAEAYRTRTFTNAHGVLMAEVVETATGRSASSNSASCGSATVEEALWDAYTFLIAPAGESTRAPQ